MALEHSADISVRRRTKRRLHPHFFYFRQPRHLVEAAAADYSDFRLCQSSSRNGARSASQTRDYTGREARSPRTIGRSESATI